MSRGERPKASYVSGENRSMKYDMAVLGEIREVVASFGEWRLPVGIPNLLTRPLAIPARWYKAEHLLAAKIGEGLLQRVLYLMRHVSDWPLPHGDKRVCDNPDIRARLHRGVGEL
jgi:hypothetical protein